MVAARDREFVEHVVEMLQAIGPVEARRMFGGDGVFIDGLMFAIIVDNILYLKVDAQTMPEFERRALAPFTYLRQGKPCRLNYYQAPEETLEDRDELRKWANQAFAVARRAATGRGN